MDDPVNVRFTSTPAIGDIAWNAAAVVRNSASSLVMGAFMTTIAVVSIWFGDYVSLWLLVFGLSLLTGLFVAPFVWWSVRQRRDLALATVEIDAGADGISMTSNQASSRQDWSFYRQARETPRAFMLDMGTMTVFLTKRGIDPVDVDGFRSLLRRVGLLKAETTLFGRFRRVIWIALGVVAASAVMLGPLAYSRLFATANLHLTPTIDGQTVHVEGTTDLPDGAIVLVEVTQLDEWDHADWQSGTDPLDWVRGENVTVAGGRFESSIDIGGWPAGRGLVSAYFWVDETQPQAVIERFGTDGSGLRGPDVYREDGYANLVVDREFTLP